MISKSSKFPLRTDFLAFRKKANHFATPHLIAYYHPSPTTSSLGVVVPKKVSKLATTRNWLKRLVYTQLWEHLGASNHDCVVVFKPAPLSRSTSTQDLLTSELTTIISRL